MKRIKQKIARLRRRLRNRLLGRVKVEITCPHGRFIPGAFPCGPGPSAYSCDDCGFVVQLSTFRGEIDW